RPEGEPPGVDTGSRRRAMLVLGGIAALIIVLFVGLVAYLLGVGRAPAAPPMPDPGITSPPTALDPDGWDIAAETELATRAMPQFPESVTVPHPLSTDSAGPPITLPAPGLTRGRWVPGGFPATAEGAAAQQVALMIAGLAGGDPQTYAGAYASVALPGAPAPDTTAMFTGLQTFRSHAGIPATGPVPALQVSWTPTSALVKGTADGGRYAVVCVLGEMTVAANGQIASGGIGDCQAFRYVDSQWRIAPGAPAAKGPSAWPGTAEAVAAGYREIG
ncbi:MAG: hypothetical protein ACREQ5_37670, partial [Candidatus Dormibacteria bacterium]